MNTKIITSLNKPDPLASNAEKATDEYGLKVAASISGEWFNGGMAEGNDNNFMGRNSFVNEMRLYFRGEQDTAQTKKFISRQKFDLKYLNQDFRTINIAEKFCNIVIAGISDDHYHLDIYSIDRFAALEKKGKRLDLKNKMVGKPMLENFKELFGIDITPKGYLPEDDEELDMYMEMKERPKVEIGEEITVNFVKETNDWKNIKEKANEDLTIAGLCGTRIYTDPDNGIMLQYVDPETYVHSYVEKNDFSDAYYHGFVDTITLSEFRREVPDISDMDLRQIAKLYGASNGSQVTDYSSEAINTLLDYRIHVLRYCYKTTKEIVYKRYLDKKNNLKKVAKRDSDFEVPDGSEKSRLSKSFETWYEGNYIIGSNRYIWGWKESENISRDEMNKPVSPFQMRATSIYKNRIKSFLKNIVPLCDQMQYIHLKIQHLMAELKPDIVELDLDMLADLSTDTKGESKSQTWELALSLLQVKGAVIKKRLDMGEEGMKDARAVTLSTQQQGSGITVLLNGWAHYYNILREVTGINPAKDGTSGQNSLVGVNQMMILASNSATKYIVDSALDFDKRVCECISSRVKGIYSFKEKSTKIQRLYEQAIGKQSIDALEPFKHRHKHEFGFLARLMPSRDEIEDLRTDLSVAIQEGTIDISQKAEIIRIAKTNLKQAEEYMAFLRKRTIKERQKEQEQMQQLQTQSNIQAAEAAAQSKTQSYAMQREIDLKYQAQLSEIELRKRQAEHQIDAPKDEKEFQWDVYKEQVKAATVMNIQGFKEQAKDMRLKDQSTHQSKMIDQRKKESPPIDFKQEDFGLGGIME